MILYPVNPGIADLWLQGQVNDAILFEAIQTFSNVYYVREMNWKTEMWHGFATIAKLRPDRVILRANFPAIEKFLHRHGAQSRYVDYIWTKLPDQDELDERVRMVWPWNDEILKLWRVRRLMISAT